MQKTKYKVTNMHCPSCATVIQMELEDAGIENKCSYNKGVLEIIGVHDFKRVVEIVKNAGYTVKA